MQNDDEQQPAGEGDGPLPAETDAAPEAGEPGMGTKGQRAAHADDAEDVASDHAPPDEITDSQPPEPPPEPEITVYHKTVWNGYVAFVCNFCGHGVLDYAGNDGEQEMQVHIWNEHQKPTAPRPPQFSGLLVDQQGRPITG